MIAGIADLPLAFLYLVVAVLLSLYFTPILRSAAIAHDIVDRPDGRLKTHAEPVPYLGGLSIFLAFLITLAVFGRFHDTVQGLLLGGSIILLLGVVDDMKAISPTVKFLGQLLAAIVLLRSGIRIEIAFLVERHPFVANVLTVLWIVGVTNAFNIIDVLDGLAAGVGAIALTFLFAIACWTGPQDLAAFPLCLAGAILGFLRFNFHPARIYLGDAGSMLIGFLVGSVALLLSYTDANPLAVAAPILILGVPLFDTALVMVLRARQGIPVFRGSPDHFAVRLRRAGFSVRKIALGSYAVSLALGGAALLLMRLGATGSILLLLALAVAAIAAGVWLARVGSPAEDPARPESAALRGGSSAREP